MIRRRGVDVEIQVEGRQRLVHLNRCKMFKRSGRVLSDTDTRERNNLSQVLPHRPASISSLNESSESNDDTCTHQSDGDYNTYEEPISPVPSMIIRRSQRTRRKPRQYRDDEQTDSEGEVMS